MLKRIETVVYASGLGEGGRVSALRGLHLYGKRCDKRSRPHFEGFTTSCTSTDYLCSEGRAGAGAVASTFAKTLGDENIYCHQIATADGQIRLEFKRKVSSRVGG